MCATCGCGTDEVRVTSVGTTHPPRQPDHGHPHDHVHEHAHDHGAAPDRPHTVDLEQRVLAKNDALAARNREWLTRRAVRAVNLMSSPGAGKTTLLERTIRESGLAVSVVEGDQETSFDARRIHAAGARAVQVNTGAGCHLDAAMVARALDALDPPEGSCVLVENVGNLVCPANFRLGTHQTVLVASVPEGDDKPYKYPGTYRGVDVLVINKIDLLPYVNFRMEYFERGVQALNPGVTAFHTSCTTGEGLDAWAEWLVRQAKQRRLSHQ